MYCAVFVASGFLTVMRRLLARICLAGLWDHTQDASLGQGGQGVPGTCSTMLFACTHRGDMGKRRASRNIVVLPVASASFVSWNSPVQV